MIYRFKVPQHSWAEAINTACYVMNGVLLRPNMPYFQIFEYPCHILKYEKDINGEFHAKVDEGRFVGSST